MIFLAQMRQCNGCGRVRNDVILTLKIWCGPLNQHPPPPARHQPHPLTPSTQTIIQEETKNPAKKTLSLCNNFSFGALSKHNLTITCHSFFFNFTRLFHLVVASLKMNFKVYKKLIIHSNIIVSLIIYLKSPFKASLKKFRSNWQICSTSSMTGVFPSVLKLQK